MKFKKAYENEKVIRIEYINSENEEDHYETRFIFDEDKKKWIPRLNGNFEEEELTMLFQISKQLNTGSKPFEINFEKDKK